MALQTGQCALRELMERRLQGYDLVALLLDGKTFAEDEMVAAVGVRTSLRIFGTPHTALSR